MYLDFEGMGLSFIQRNSIMCLFKDMCIMVTFPKGRRLFLRGEKLNETQSTLYFSLLLSSVSLEVRVALHSTLYFAILDFDFA
jgi:hypothetical protein